MPTDHVFYLFQPPAVAPQLPAVAWRLETTVTPAVPTSWAPLVPKGGPQVLPVSDCIARGYTGDPTGGTCLAYWVTTADGQAYARGYSSNAEVPPKESLASQPILLPESHVGLSFFLIVLVIMAAIGTDENHPKKRR